MVTINKLSEDIKSIINTTLKNICGKKLVKDYMQKNLTNKDHISILSYSSPQAILAVGKAAVSMTNGAIDFMDKDTVEKLEKVLVVTKYHHNDHSLKVACKNLTIIESSHPIPDNNSLLAGKLITELCSSINHKNKNFAKSYILILISGGTSALVESLKAGFNLEQLQKLNKEMLDSGADITQINRKRKEISLLKNGGVAKLLADSQVLALYLSDVPSNSIATIGSGILAGSNNNIYHRIVADNKTAREELKKATTKFGYQVMVHDNLFTEDINKTANKMYDIMSCKPGVIHIFGGEPTIKLPPKPAPGGRNQHLALLMAQYLAQDNAAVFASIGTDGTDGFTNYAGAIVDNRTIEKIKSCSISVEEKIKTADSSTALVAVKATIETGVTGTNLMDLMIGYISR